MRYAKRIRPILVKRVHEIRPGDVFSLSGVPVKWICMEVIDGVLFYKNKNYRGWYNKIEQKMSSGSMQYARVYSSSTLPALS